jgi:hypothetical protein
MIEAVIHRLKCDGCRLAWISPVADTPEQAWAAAALAGWTRSAGFDVCPRCTRKAEQADPASVGGAGS